MRLVQTCTACPEQYDVFDDNGGQIGYLRLRHGHFTAQIDGPGGAVVYEANPQGDGIFEPDERDEYLTAALTEIAWRTLPAWSSVAATVRAAIDGVSSREL